MTKLIVNADDFGLSEAVNYGIISAYKNGIVSINYYNGRNASF